MTGLENGYDNEIAQLAREVGINTGADLHRSTGLERSYCSRLFNGGRTTVGPETVVRLTEAFELRGARSLRFMLEHLQTQHGSFSQEYIDRVVDEIEKDAVATFLAEQAERLQLADGTDREEFVKKIMYTLADNTKDIVIEEPEKPIEEPTTIEPESAPIPPTPEPVVNTEPRLFVAGGLAFKPNTLGAKLKITEKFGGPVVRYY